MADNKDSLERAKELLVYFPVGFAMYLRDHGPSFLKVFVSRGRSEVQRGQHSVNEQLHQVRTAGEAAVESNGAPVLNFVTDGLTTVREWVEEALGTLGALANLSTGETDVGPDAGAAGAPDNGRTSWTTTTPDASATSVLAIDGYDTLSASEIVERLDGLGRPDLETIRVYETAHRARNTILGKIEQLTRGN